MEIQIDKLSKRYVTHWVFRDLSLIIPAGGRLGITGPNGSGKSTFLHIVCGMLTPTSGKITYAAGDQSITQEEVALHVAFAAPYSELIEEMTLTEAMQFHARFRNWNEDVRDAQSFAAMLEYPYRQDQQIRYMSSGMKQRLRLAVALFTKSSILALDEPTSNLDEEGIAWFHKMLARNSQGRTALIASNVAEDYASCTLRLDFGAL